MTNTEFDCANEFLHSLATQLSYPDANDWTLYEREKSGTNDDYKLKLLEKTQFFYKIKHAENVITDYSTQRQYPFWAISEIISEVFAFNPPLMYKYKPEIIEWAYKLRPDKSIEYMYGRRWNEWNQLLNVIKTLSDRLDSKRAVVDIFTPYDTDPNRNDVPCTLMYTLKARKGKLDMTTFFRSHDLFSGMKYDMVLSSFINQLIAMGVNTTLGDMVLEPGKLGFYEDSLHVYVNKDQMKLDKFTDEAHLTTADARFDIMHKYKTLESLFDDLWQVAKVEEHTYHGKFTQANKFINKIQNPAFADFAKMYYNRNAKFCKSTAKGKFYTTRSFIW